MMNEYENGVHEPSFVEGDDIALRSMYAERLMGLSTRDMGYVSRMIGKMGLFPSVREFAQDLAIQEHRQGIFEHFEDPSSVHGFAPLNQFSDFLEEQGFTSSSPKNRLLNVLDRLTRWESPQGEWYPILQWADPEKPHAETGHVLSTYLKSNPGSEDDFRIDIGALDECLQDRRIYEDKDLRMTRQTPTAQILRDFVDHVKSSASPVPQ